MILRDLLQLVLFIGLLAALSPLLGRYVHQVFSGRRTFLHPVLGPVERGVYSPVSYTHLTLPTICSV